jgi:GntR family transcriptional regulator, transcriptional repressor for pyruvate dehydrogenase complex
MEEPITKPDLKIKRVNVGEETFNTILNMILSNKWKTGDKLPSENEFHELLGVSRHTIRVALNNLRMLGIIVTRQGDGNYLQSLGIGLYMDHLMPYVFATNDNYQTILEFRQGIESVTAYYAAQRATEDDISLLKEKLDICNRSIEKHDEYFINDFEFHFAIAKISQNEMLIQSMYIVKKYCYSRFNEYISDSIAHDGLKYHTQILEAIQNHEPDLAMNCMNRHIENILTKLTPTV